MENNNYQDKYDEYIHNSHILELFNLESFILSHLIENYLGSLFKKKN